MFPLVVRRTLESDDDALMQVKFTGFTLEELGRPGKLTGDSFENNNISLQSFQNVPWGNYVVF